MRLSGNLSSSSDETPGHMSGGMIPETLLELKSTIRRVLHDEMESGNDRSYDSN